MTDTPSEQTKSNWKTVKWIGETIGVTAIVTGIACTAIMYYSTSKLIDKANQLAGDLMVQNGEMKQKLDADADQIKGMETKIASDADQTKIADARIAETTALIGQLNTIDPDKLKRVLDQLQRPEAMAVADNAAFHQQVAALGKQVACIYEAAGWYLPSLSSPDKPMTNRYAMTLDELYYENVDRIIQQATDGTISPDWTVSFDRLKKLVPSAGDDADNRKVTKSMDDAIEKDIQDGKLPPPEVLQKELQHEAGPKPAK